MIRRAGAHEGTAAASAAGRGTCHAGGLSLHRPQNNLIKAILKKGETLRGMRTCTSDAQGVSWPTRDAVFFLPRISFLRHRLALLHGHLLLSERKSKAIVENLQATEKWNENPHTEEPGSQRTALCCDI